MNLIDELRKEELPQISIGMPIYNGEQFLHQRLESILSQTFTDFELIISDNASTDSTGKICEEYARKDHRIRYIRQEKNIGALLNFNFVLKEAKFNYFVWMASDDIISTTSSKLSARSRRRRRTYSTPRPGRRLCPSQSNRWPNIASRSSSPISLAAGGSRMRPCPFTEPNG